MMGVPDASRSISTGTYTRTGSREGSIRNGRPHALAAISKPSGTRCVSVLHHLAHHTACRTLGVSQRQRAGRVCARVLLLRERELTGPRPSSYLSDNLRPFRPPEMAQVGPAPNPAPQPRSTQLSLELADPAVAHGQSFIRVAAESAFKFAWKFLEWVPVANAPDVRVDRAAFEAALMPALTPSSGYAQRLGRQGSPNFTSFIETEFLPDALASFATELRDAKAFDNVLLVCFRCACMRLTAMACVTSALRSLTSELRHT